MLGGGYHGDALANVFKYAGATVEREYYNNDSGNQIMELGQSIISARDGIEIEKGYKGEYIQVLAHNITATDPYEAGKQAATSILESSIKPTINRMGIAFDRFSSEQALLDKGMVQKVIDIVTKLSLTYEKDGALWLKATQIGDEKDRVLRRSDELGNYTYLAKDIAYHWDKINRGYSDIVTIVGADHFTEAKILENVVKNILAPKAEWEGQFTQPIIQFVRLIRDGQEIKMSKRAGTYITVNDLLDEIPSDVARFFFLMRDLNSHMDFDLTLARDSSDKNPVFYVQYAFVRAKHILEKAGAERTHWSTENLNDEERKLLIHIFSFPKIIASITKTYDVHTLAYYALDLAKCFHAFYALHPVLQAEQQIRQRRLILTRITYEVLKQSLTLLGISHPERMISDSSRD